MKIYIDRTHCDLCQSYCDRHVAKLIRSPLGRDRPCIQSLEELLHSAPGNVFHGPGWSFEVTRIGSSCGRFVIGSRMGIAHHGIPLCLGNLHFSHLEALADAHPVYRIFIGGGIAGSHHELACRNLHKAAAINQSGQ